jgi:hypothetical protein
MVLVIWAIILAATSVFVILYVMAKADVSGSIGSCVVRHLPWFVCAVALVACVAAWTIILWHSERVYGYVHLTSDSRPGGG